MSNRIEILSPRNSSEDIQEFNTDEYKRTELVETSRLFLVSPQDSRDSYFNLLISDHLVTYIQPSYTKQKYIETFSKEKFKGLFCRIGVCLVDEFKDKPCVMIHLWKPPWQIEKDYEKFLQETGSERHAPFCDKLPLRWIDRWERKVNSGEFEDKLRRQDQAIQEIMESFKNDFELILELAIKDRSGPDSYPENEVCRRVICLYYKKASRFHTDAPLYSTLAKYVGLGPIVSQESLRREYDLKNTYWITRVTKNAMKWIRNALPPSPFSDAGWGGETVKYPQPVNRPPKESTSRSPSSNFLSIEGPPSDNQTSFFLQGFPRD